MKALTMVSSMLVLVLGGGCTTSATDLGDVTVATYSLHIAREGDAAAAGVHTRFVIKPNSGGNPTSIMGWVGLEDAEGSVKAAAVYDPADGDFDDDVVCPSPLPAGSKFYFAVFTGDVPMTGSIELK